MNRLDIDIFRISIYIVSEKLILWYTFRSW